MLDCASDEQLKKLSGALASDPSLAGEYGKYEEKETARVNREYEKGKEAACSKKARTGVSASLTALDQHSVPTDMPASKIAKSRKAKVSKAKAKVSKAEAKVSKEVKQIAESIAEREERGHAAREA